MASYREIRRRYQPHDWWCPSLIDHYAYLISPLFTGIFVKAGIAPNSVTVLMIAAGMIGAILFAGPQLWLKVYGLLFLHLWYVLDCSDGEVARITGTFSKFGKEMDYTAHLVNHPLFNLAFASSLAALDRSNLRLIVFAAILSISAELVLRHLLTLQGIFEVKMGVTIGARGRRGMFTKSLLLVVGFFCTYTNFVLLFPVVYCVDCYCGTSISLYYFFIQTAMSTLVAGREACKWIGMILVAG